MVGTKAEDLRSAANFKLAAAINACTAMMTAKLFDPSQPRDDHGRWTSGGGGGGGGASTPPRPETLRSNIYGLLNQWSELASSSNVGSNLILANNLDALAGAIVDWLGTAYKR